jgi:hypothetical protein
MEPLPFTAGTAAAGAPLNDAKPKAIRQLPLLLDSSHENDAVAAPSVEMARNGITTLVHSE